jgi:selT/selW/selH-like putative selenoprotein
MIKGRNGIFDVHLDGELVYSKHQTFRFPEPGEVEAELRKRIGAA